VNLEKLVGYVEYILRNQRHIIDALASEHHESELSFGRMHRAPTKVEGWTNGCATCLLIAAATEQNDAEINKFLKETKVTW
jgi:hypothetical protein